MSDLISSVYRARRALDEIGRVPVRIVSGPRAWANLVQQATAHILTTYAYTGHQTDARLFGLPVIVRQDKHPDYLAVEYSDGTVLPVAET